MDDGAWTKFPNVLFALAPSLSESELRVMLAVVRCTWGWNKRSDKISLSRLQELTGMSRQGVVNGVDRLEKKGWLRVGGGAGCHTYELARDYESAGQRSGLGVVNEVDQRADLAGQRSRPELVNEVDRGGQRSRPELVNEVDTQKKGKKKSTEKKEKRATAKPSPPRTPSHYGKYFAAIAAACGMNPKAGAHAKRISAAAKFLTASVPMDSAGAEDVVERFAAWWTANDWRARKGEVIKPEHFVNEWPQFAKPAKPSGRMARAALDEEIEAAEEEARRMLDDG